VETEAVVGAHNNQPTDGSDMTAEMAFASAAVATGDGGNGGNGGGADSGSGDGST